ncbi:MAG: hypothetical protein R3F20_04920 [Planctomycetota bacterium]
MSAVRFTAVVFAAIVLGSALRAQDRVIGYTDVRDDRTASTGMATALGQQARSGVRFVRFELDDAASFRPEEWDAILFSSFIEAEKTWDAFARREGARVLAAAERGALVVFFNRDCEADGVNRGERLPERSRLEPSGWQLLRSNDAAPDEFYVDDGHPLWRGLGRKNGDGDFEVESRRMGGKRNMAFDPFRSVGGPGIVESAWAEVRSRGTKTRPLAIHGPVGRNGGEVWYLQVILDKVDACKDQKSLAFSRAFFSNLVGIIAARPRTGRSVAPPPPVDPKPIEPRPVPPTPVPPTPVDPDPADPDPVDPPPTPRPQSVTVLGRVFSDADRDGVQGASERGIAGVRLTDQVRELRSDATGRFAETFVGGVPRTISLEVPDRHEMPRGAAPWWTVVEPREGGYEVRLEYALRPADDPDRARVVAVAFRPLDGPAAVAPVLAALESVCESESPSLLLVLPGPQADETVAALDEGLTRLSVARDLAIRWVSPKPRQRTEEVGAAGVAGQPLRSALVTAGHRLVVAAAPEPGARSPGFDLWLSLNREATLVACGLALDPARRARMDAANVIVPGPVAAESGLVGVPGLLAEAAGPSYLVVDLRRGEEPGFRVVGPRAAEVPTPPGPPAPSDLPRHPLVVGDLAEALREALEGR